MDKKGFMKTLEALVAVVILTVFLVYVAVRIDRDQPEAPDDIKLVQDTVMSKISENEFYRNCTIKDDRDCVNLLINSTIPLNLNYTFKICPSINCDLPDLPEDIEIYADSLILSSTLDEKDITVLNLYIWRKINI
jgi:hypothetical protein